MIQLIRRQLFEHDEGGFLRLLSSLKQSGVPQIQVYDCLVKLWGELNADEHDLELDRLSNWISLVMGRVAPEYRVWDERL